MHLSKEKLKTIVLQAKLLTEAELNQVIAYAKQENVSTEEALIRKKVITDPKLGKLVATNLKIPFVELSKIELSPITLSIIPERIAHKTGSLVFSKDDKTIKVAISNPDNIELLKMIAHKTGLQVIAHYATARDIEKAFIHYKTNYQKLFKDLLSEDRSQIITTAAHDPPIKKMVDLLIETAQRENASDIHIEPRERDFLIRFRVDGILRDILVLSKDLHDRVVTRIKVMSRLRIDEHLSSQDGKINTKVDDERLDLRISILPIANGEKVVMRLLRSKAQFSTLSDLGMSKKDLTKVTQAFKSSYGMIICTGPTGSGKTTTIYTIIKHINTREINITSIEDPIEYQIKGANQVQVNEKTNLTFANGLRSILRQDPDSIFVGEIRDNETASIAINAALTGHLVFSTLHTNDAATALPRLFDMEVEPFLAASTVNLIIAQRLVRKICDKCKIGIETPREEIVKFFLEDKVSKYFDINVDDEGKIKSKSTKKSKLIINKGKGCKFCHNSGYSGRVGVYEIIQLTKSIRDLVSNKSTAEEITKQAISEGMTTMYEDGLSKISQGLTTVEEVLRVTKAIE